MVRKNQLKRFSIEKLSEFSANQTDGQTLTIVREIIEERNDTLKNEKQKLLQEIDYIRKETGKALKQMNDGVKDRLQKRELIVMDKDSRPTKENVKQLTDLFAYFENQTNIIDRNNKDMDMLFEEKQSQIQALLAPNPELEVNFAQQIQDFDKQYERLNKQCDKEQQKKVIVEQQQRDFENHVSNIHESIEQYRIKYEEVESVIRQRERELDHLTTYFRNRKAEDEQNIERERRLGHLLEGELLKAQAITNHKAEQNNELLVHRAQLIASIRDGGSL